METRSSDQIISDQILGYFYENKIPSWKDMYPYFVKEQIMTLASNQRFSEEFFKKLFCDSAYFKDKYQFFTNKHYILIISLLKAYYKLETCYFCDHIYRKVNVLFPDV